MVERDKAGASYDGAIFRRVYFWFTWWRLCRDSNRGNKKEKTNSTTVNEAGFHFVYDCVRGTLPLSLKFFEHLLGTHIEINFRGAQVIVA